MNDLKNIAPELSKIKKENPFEVPDHYFDDFTARLQHRIETEETGNKKQQNTIIRFLKPALGLAASFALIFMLVYWPLKSFLPNQVAQTETTNELEDQEYMSIVEDLDETSFFAFLNESDDQSDFSDEDLESYIAANTSDYELFVGTEK